MKLAAPGAVPATLLREIDSRLAGHAQQGTDALRLFHGRGRCFAGLEFLSVDWFEPVALVTLHTDGAQPWLVELSEHLRSRLGDSSGRSQDSARLPSQRVRSALKNLRYLHPRGVFCLAIAKW